MKRKITVTLDEALVAALDGEGALSSQLNEAGWEVVRRRERTTDLRNLLDALDQTDGAKPDDPIEDARLRRLLGGTA